MKLRISSCRVPGVRKPDGGELPDDGGDLEPGERERTRAAAVGEGDLGRPGGMDEGSMERGGEVCVDDKLDVLGAGAYRAAAMAAISAASTASLLVLMVRGSPDLSLGGVRMLDVSG
jgi:hypothetical protein